MRLIRTSNFSLTSFTGETPPYAILSHRWENDELTYQDTESRSFRSKRGFQKVQEACRIAERYGCKWLWIDTCCINKQDLAELQEAINAMYRWYKEAHVCIAYLFDHTDRVNALEKSSWFVRCWTLQELIAPQDVKFYDNQWTYIGSKTSRASEIAAITGIPKFVLRGGDPQQCSVAQRMSWASHRKATRIEDEAYSLIGLLGLVLQPLYGIGSQAFQELQHKLLQKHDQSILAWDRSRASSGSKYTGLLADSPAVFASCRTTQSIEAPIGSVRLVGDAIELDALTIPYGLGVYLCILECTSTAPDRQDAIFLQQLDAADQYARIIRSESSVTTVSRKQIRKDVTCRRRKVYVYHQLRHAPLKIISGFLIPRISLLEKYRSKHDHDQVRFLSHLDGPVDMSQHGALVRLPHDHCGTAGLVYFGKSQRNFREWPIDGIKLGFDANFRPIVRLGVGTRAMGDLRAWTRDPPEPGTREFRRVWNSSWIHEKLKTIMKTDKISRGNDSYEMVRREYSSAEYFHHRGFEQIEARSPKGASIYRYDLGIDVSLVLCDFIDAEHPYRKGEQPWKVWTLKIREERDFAKERQERHSMIAVGSAALAGGLIVRHFEKSR